MHWLSAIFLRNDVDLILPRRVARFELCVIELGCATLVRRVFVGAFVQLAYKTLIDSSRLLCSAACTHCSTFRRLAVSRSPFAFLREARPMGRVRFLRFF